MTALIINGMAAIQTVAPTLSVGEIQLSADNRSTKENKLTDEQRIRRVVLASNFWGELSATRDNERSQGLTDILRSALVKLGSERLRDQLNETPSIREVAVKDYTVAELLRWSEETATSRGSITFTRAEAEAWFDASSTKETRIAMYKEQGRSSAWQTAALAKLRNRFGALAAKNHGIAVSEDALHLLSLIDPVDAEIPLVAEIIGRLTHVSKQLATKEAEEIVNTKEL